MYICVHYYIVVKLLYSYKFVMILTVAHDFDGVVIYCQRDINLIRCQLWLVGQIPPEPSACLHSHVCYSHCVRSWQWHHNGLQNLARVRSHVDGSCYHQKRLSITISVALCNLRSSVSQLFLIQRWMGNLQKNTTFLLSYTPFWWFLGMLSAWCSCWGMKWHENTPGRLAIPCTLAKFEQF